MLIGKYVSEKRIYDLVLTGGITRQPEEGQGVILFSTRCLYSSKSGFPPSPGGLWRMLSSSILSIITGLTLLDSASYKSGVIALLPAAIKTPSLPYSSVLAADTRVVETSTRIKSKYRHVIKTYVYGFIQIYIFEIKSRCAVVFVSVGASGILWGWKDRYIHTISRVPKRG